MKDNNLSGGRILGAVMSKRVFTLFSLSLFLPLLFLSSCATTPHGPAKPSFGTRLGQTLNHETSLFADLLSAHIQSGALFSATCSSITGPFTVAILPVTWRPPALTTASNAGTLTIGSGK